MREPEGSVWLKLRPPSVPRDRPSAAECLSHPWLWQLCLSPDSVAIIRERISGSKWAAPSEDPEDKENFLESPHSKRFRYEEAPPAEFC